jgi:hypothetical protein
LLLAMQAQAQGGATGDPCKGTAAQARRGTTFTSSLSTFARCSTASKGPLPVVGVCNATDARCAAHLPAKYLCLFLATFAFLLSNATYARCATASKVPLPAVGYLCFLLTNATQLMPAAQPPAKYLCLLLATCAFYLRNAKAQVQRKGKRGGNSSKCISTAEGNRGGNSASKISP